MVRDMMVSLFQLYPRLNPFEIIQVAHIDELITDGEFHQLLEFILDSPVGYIWRLQKCSK